ncbi:MAG: DNA-binding response regulator, partial [Flaviaesturariibacter sp.]|nr:DNA-binding response regulator [Flaviaesturariibacter sp.]
ELSPRELQLIKLVCQQKTSKEIAEKMGYSFRTIEEFRGLLMRKIGVKGPIGIAFYAVKNGIYKIK